MELIIKASGVIILFYICYKTLLQNETFFQSNRWFLITGFLGALCFPFIIIPKYIEYVPTLTEFNISDYNTIQHIQNESTITADQIIIWVYTLGFIFFFLRLIIQFFSLYKLLKSNKSSKNQKYIYIKTKNNIAPFSFFNWIVYNPNQFNEKELEYIITHEKVHVNQWHSIDIIISQLACVILWFNPFIWLYKKEIQQNLEFIADHKAQKKSNCEKSYQQLLLKSSISNHQLVLANNFYNSLIKKRIVMLHKSKSNKLRIFKYATILPALALFLISANTKEIYIETSKNIETNNIIPNLYGDIHIVITKDFTEKDLEAVVKKASEDKITLSFSDIKRNSKGEIIAITAKFNSDKVGNGVYEIESEEPIADFVFTSNENQTGFSTVSNNTFSFKSKDGTQKIQSSGNGSNVIVVEGVEYDSKFNQAGDTIYYKINQSVDTLNYKIKKTIWVDENKTKTNINASENGNVMFISKTSDEPIYIVNGKIVDKSTLEDVDSDDIKSVNILKGKVAKEAYGDKGKNGVVILTKKDSKSLFDDSDERIEIESNIFIESDSKEQPLIILNNKEISKTEMNAISPNDIESVEVLKNENAIKTYGNKGKDGVIVINTKNKGTWEIKTEVNSVHFIGDDKSEKMALYYITKTATDAILNQHKSALKQKGIEMNYSKLKRNKAGEIMSIKISLKDSNGKQSSATWKDNINPIPTIEFGKLGEQLIVRSKR